MNPCPFTGPTMLGRLRRLMGRQTNIEFLFDAPGSGNGIELKSASADQCLGYSGSIVGLVACGGDTSRFDARQDPPPPPTTTT